MPALRDKEADGRRGAAAASWSTASDRPRQGAGAERAPANSPQRLEQIDGDVGRERETHRLHRRDDRPAAGRGSGAAGGARERARRAEDALRDAVSESERLLASREATLAEATDAGAEVAARRRQFERIVREESQRMTRLAGQLGEIETETARLGAGGAGDEITALAAAVEAARTAAGDAETRASEAEASAAAAREARESARAGR